MTEQQTSDRDRTEEGPQPQPEHDEPRLADPTPGDLSKRDFLAILVRAGKDSLKDRITNLSAALAYYAFLAIPSLMLVAVGVFSLVADEDAVTEINQRLEGVVPQEALTLLDDTLRRVTETQSNSGLALIIVGLGSGVLDADRFDADADVGAQHGLRPRGDAGIRQAASDCARDGLADAARVRSRVRPARARAAPLGLDRFGGRARVVRGLAVVDCPVAPADRRPSVRVRDDPLPGTERRPSPLALRDVRDGDQRRRLAGRLRRVLRSTSASSPRTTRRGAHSQP